MRALAFLALLALACSPAAAEPAPLFSNDATIDIKITGPIRDIAAAAARSTDPHPATLEVMGAAHETLPIELSPRGLSRRDRAVCQFPPLRVKFTEKPGDASLFKKQGTLKLVTHCRASESFQQYTLLEYATYRLFNVITDVSFRVRLAHVEYVDSENGKTIAKRIGFFIEDVDDLGKRFDKKEIERPQATVQQLDGKVAATAILFQYMISNLDWDALNGPTGEDCCHNGRLLGDNSNATAGLYYLPYDFDYAGLVDAPYAVPPEKLGVKTVRQRVYRGFCQHNNETYAAAQLFRDRKAAIYAELAKTPELSDKTKSKAAKFLDGFFEIIEDQKSLESKIIKKCR